MQATIALHPTATRVRSIANPWPALGVLFIGLIVLYAVGFSTVTKAHNAAHDTRHANGLPCH
jgi:cobalt transporter subunit CbtB